MFNVTTVWCKTFVSRLIQTMKGVDKYEQKRIYDRYVRSEEFVCVFGQIRELILPYQDE